MLFYSEYGQDQWLVENVFADRRDGVFVEAGALDGLGDSNTLFFERERNWRGLLIEANPGLISKLRANRPQANIVECALASAVGSATFELCVNRGWSGLARYPHERRASVDTRSVTVKTRPLADVLREYQIAAVDYLSLDIEGAELDVLGGFPFRELPIEVIGVEDNTGNNEPLRALLRSQGYAHLARVGVDEFWRRLP